MSASIVFSGPPLSPQRALALMKEIAPLVIGRPLSLVRVEGGSLSDGNGAAACWFETWADGDVTLSATVDNDSGNPRDGWGYSITLKLMSRYLDKPQWWRAEINGGGWEPMLSSPFRVGLLGVTPADYEVIRARLVALLPEHRDQSFADAYAILATLEDFVNHGHSDWVKAYYAGQTSLPAPRLSAYLCAHKTGLMGPDPITAGTWVELEIGRAHV